MRPCRKLVKVGSGCSDVGSGSDSGEVLQFGALGRSSCGAEDTKAREVLETVTSKEGSKIDTR